MKRPKYVQGRRPGDDRIHYEVVSGIYEKYYQIKPGDVVVDAGAHAGFFTSLAADKVGASGLVVSFEPEPDNFKLLCENTAEYKNVTIDNAALWEQDGLFLNLYLSHSCAEHSLVYKQDKSAVISVPTKTLDTALSKVTKNVPSLLKIDVEGSELQVLIGAVNVLKIGKPSIAIELAEDKILGISNLLKTFHYNIIVERPAVGGILLYAIP